MNKLLINILLCCCSINAQSIISGDLESYIDIYLSNIPHSSSSDEYQNPPDSLLFKWADAIGYIISGNFDSAHVKAYDFGYQVVKFTDTSEAANTDYFILERKATSTNYWGIFIFNPDPVRQKLVIQSTHPLFDSNTGKESLVIFKRSGARALFISGAHRCNSSVLTSCSGTTTACSSTSQKYRISDQAHVVNGTFQKTTEVMIGLIENIIIIQPHGFAKLTGDPDLIMSNGTQLTPSGTDYLLLLKQNLLALDNSLTFKIAHVDLSWTRLIATTNTQGRLINGSTNPCNLNSPSTNGRFLHVEQAYAKLRDTKANWIKFADAVTMTIPEDPMVSADDDQVSQYEFLLYQNYPNPFNPLTTINYSIKQSGFVSLKVFDILGRIVGDIVNEEQSKGNYSCVFNGHDLSSGVYLIVLSVGDKVISNKMILAK